MMDSSEERSKEIDEMLAEILDEEAGDARKVRGMEEAMERLARLPAAYYAALSEAGAPHELAYDLVMQWHHIFWSNAVGSRR